MTPARLRKRLAGQLYIPLGIVLRFDPIRRVFSHVSGVGRDRQCLPGMDGFWGGVVTPGLALPELTGLRIFSP